jgi:hypothetical protein
MAESGHHNLMAVLSSGKDFGAHRVEGWVGPGDGLFGKEETLFLLLGFEP